MPKSSPKSGVHSEAFLNWLEKNANVQPYFAAHGTDEDIQAKMTKLLPKKWTMQGNRLIGETEMGEVTLNTPTDMILISSEPDSKGLPQLKKIGV